MTVRIHTMAKALPPARTPEVSELQVGHWQEVQEGSVL